MGTANGVTNALRSRREQLPGFREGDDIARLLECSKDDLYFFGIDVRVVKRALELREEVADLQARGAALDAEITPLAQLVDSLNRYVKEHNRG